MNIAFFYSLILKGIGAILEILVQIVVTDELGVAGYGAYSTWINGADVIFWVLFSGIIKCNTYYLSDGNTTIRAFKRKYYLRYALPAILVMAMIAVTVSGTVFGGVILVITGLELLTLDRGSILLAHGKAFVSLLGEYVLGRFVLLVGIVWLILLKRINLQTLLLMYLIQYGCILFFYIRRMETDKNHPEKTEANISLRKLGAYQRADVVQAMISQMPVIIQYLFAGAFEAGVVSVVLLVKKLINFISGPTAKVFLPEFSRLYKNGDKEQLHTCFAAIMRLQMLFVGPIAVALIGFPQVILGILAEELIAYSNLFVLCACIFLVAASLGPCGGMMQMTGNERKDNFIREMALGCMLLSMLVFSKSRMFVLYGLCVQTAVEAIVKFAFVCRWLGQIPGGLQKMIRWWMPTLVAIIWISLFCVRQTFANMIIFAAAVFAVGVVAELRANDSVLRELFATRKGGSV